MGLPTAFLAGIVSFASPCVLPLVPAYLSFLAGVSYEDVRAGNAETRARVIVGAVAFCLGFSLVFVALGASATFVGRLLDDYAPLLSKIAGALIILLGLQLMGVLRIRALEGDRRFHPVFRQSSPLRAFAIGLAFAFGWTPCVGPVLAAILALAGSSGSVARGVALLGTYSLGIALPFLAAAVAFGAFSKAYDAIKKQMRAVEIGAGALLVITGALILTGTLATVSGWLLDAFPVFSKVG